MAARERDETVRAAWREAVIALSNDRLVFVDESGTNIGMTPRYGRAPRGARAHGIAPRNTGKNTTLLAALMPEGVHAAMVIEGATDTAVMTAFVAEVLVPRLTPGQVVVWDNLSVHKASRLAAMIEACGCRVLFLPPYSPDFNPIELAFSKIKTALRQLETRTLDALWQAIGRLLSMITAADVQGWYRHCGYALDGLSM
ncbi:MAG: IS630 family transposase [Chloroflexia bacterium]|nr:IS630 family transposase [Chloroflexia bacterium]